MFEKSDELLNDALTLTPLAGTSIATWSEDKRKDFVNVFKQRSDDAQTILARTAYLLLEGARKHYFLSPPKADALKSKLDITSRRRGYYHQEHGRAGELQNIAALRAAAILEEFPSVIKTWSILQPEVAVQMKTRDTLVAKLKQLGLEFSELQTDIKLSDMDQDMTIGAFRKYVEDVRDKRDALIKQMNRVAEQGNTLSRQIDKALYAGVPELTTAVTKVVNMHIDRITAFGTTTRRIEERVLFGDSQAALDILKTFEQDELEVGKEVKAEFTTVLAGLGLGKAPRAAKKIKKSKKA